MLSLESISLNAYLLSLYRSSTSKPKTAIGIPESLALPLPALLCELVDPADNFLGGKGSAEIINLVI